MSLRERLLRFLRVPAAPSAPAGDEDVRIFRASPRYFFYRVVHWLFGNVGGAIGLLIALSMAGSAHLIIPDRIPLNGALFEWLGIGGYLTERTMLFLLGLIEVGAIIVFITQAIGSLILLRLDFEQRWYLVSDRSLRTREGLVRLHEKTMTFANIQHLSIRQGPIQRLLGIADLQIRTAGGGGTSGNDEEAKSEDLHVAYFRGIDNAAEVREVIRGRLQRHRDAGLGDPDDVPGESPLIFAQRRSGYGENAGDLIGAARSLAEEARALRRQMLTA